LVGWDVGSLVGWDVGCGLGTWVGLDVGRLLGLGVGKLEGVPLQLSEMVNWPSSLASPSTNSHTVPASARSYSTTLQ
jgi:hypothetical protein